jgi:hypothetical protein
MGPEYRPELRKMACRLAAVKGLLRGKRKRANQHVLILRDFLISQFPARGRRFCFAELGNRPH